MKNKIKFITGREEAKEAARELLLNYVKPTYNYTLASTTTRTEDGEENSYSLTLLPNWVKDIPEEERLRKYPTAFVAQMGSTDSYRVYLCLYDRLPFYAKHLTELPMMLAMLAPTLKPTEPITVEAAHTAEGRELLDMALFCESAEGNIAEELLNTDKALKVYTLFDNFGTLTPEEVKEEIEKGYFDGGVTDVERALTTITGEIYTSEEQYLTALSKLCTATSVKKYKKQIIQAYRFYKAIYFVEWLEYQLRMTEDYGALAEQLPELKKAYGITPQDMETITEDTYTEAELALARYLSNYFECTAVYDGLTNQRIAEYLNAPYELIERIDREGIYRSATLKW